MLCAFMCLLQMQGDMSRVARTKALAEFQNSPPTTVFLLSVRSGACGINLTTANNVFMMEPCLNVRVTSHYTTFIYIQCYIRSQYIVRVKQSHALNFVMMSANCFLETNTVNQMLLLVDTAIQMIVNVMYTLRCIVHVLYTYS
jgi:Helicase conserved C-terminal domain